MVYARAGQTINSLRKSCTTIAINRLDWIIRIQVRAAHNKWREINLLIHWTILFAFIMQSVTSHYRSMFISTFFRFDKFKLCEPLDFVGYFNSIIRKLCILYRTISLGSSSPVFFFSLRLSVCDTVQHDFCFIHPNNRHIEVRKKFSSKSFLCSWRTHAHKQTADKSSQATRYRTMDEMFHSFFHALTTGYRYRHWHRNKKREKMRRKKESESFSSIEKSLRLCRWWTLNHLSFLHQTQKCQINMTQSLDQHDKRWIERFSACMIGGCVCMHDETFLQPKGHAFHIIRSLIFRSIVTKSDVTEIEWKNNTQANMQCSVNEKNDLCSQPCQMWHTQNQDVCVNGASFYSSIHSL